MNTNEQKELLLALQIIHKACGIQAEPLPPTTEQKPEREAQRAFDSPQSESPPQGTDAPPEDTTPNTGFWRRECMKLREEIASLTKERDEALGWKDVAQSWELAVKTWRERAEQAEKKLAEVEKLRQEAHEGAVLWHQRYEQIISKLSTCEEDLLEESAKSELLEQKLQQAEASEPRWVPVSARVPTIKDADQHGNVWVLAKDEVFAEVPWNVSYMDRLLCWMTPIPAPLPTPTEEKDAFEAWAEENELIGVPHTLELVKKAFLAGQQSAK